MIFEPVNGRSDLIDPSDLGGVGQRILDYPLLFKFDAMIGQPTGDAH